LNIFAETFNPIPNLAFILSYYRMLYIVIKQFNFVKKLLKILPVIYLLFTLNSFAQLSVSITNTVNVPCNGSCDGSATATPSGGTLPYTYLWDDPFTQTDSIADSLCAGTYTVRVIDAVPDTVFTAVTITGPGGLTSGISSVTNASCNNVCNGQATVTVSGGAGPYTYLWTNGDNTPTADSLCAGTDTVVVTDNSGCITTAIVTITEPPIFVASISIWTDITCNSLCDGTATVTVFGGTPPYTYTWLDQFFNPIGQITTTADSLCAEPYIVQVEDTNGCLSVASIPINEPTVLTAAITATTNASCNSVCDGDATVTASGGTSPYTYSWSNSDSTAIADSLCAGVPYTVTVTDANGCDTTASVTITEPPVLTSAIIDSTNVSCNGLCDGDATVGASGGTQPYTYLWTNSDTTATADSLCAVLIYSVIITDDNGCTVSNSVTISEPPALTSGITSTNVNCGGACDGSATLTISGGTAPYTYLWNPTSQTDSTATGLCTGTHNATITDANGCTIISSTITITEPDTLVDSLVSMTPSQCLGACDGSAAISVSGGTPPYTYLWNDPDTQTTAIADSLCASTYIVTVTDSNGCIATLNVIVEGPGGLSSTIDTNINASCNGLCDGVAVVLATGGTTPYTFAWIDVFISDTIPGKTDSIIDSLCAGNYIAVVTDSNGCKTTAPLITINEPTAFSVNITGMGVSCNGDSDGTATASLTNGIPLFDYVWSSGVSTLNSTDTTNTETGLTIGTYTVTVIDNNGCIAIDSVLITEPPILTTVITDSTDASCGGVCDGSATVATSGGTAPYIYQWDNPAAQTDSFADSLCIGINTVTITDANGCNTTAIVTIFGPPVLTATITNSTNISCNDSCDGTVTVTAGGGLAPYAYLWSNGDTTSTADTLCAGIHTVIITDANICTAMDSTIIIDPPLLIATITNSKDVCGGACDGDATVSSSGGTTPYTYLWTNGDVTSTSDTLCAGNYTVTVTDANGCIDTDSVVIISDTQPPTADAGNDTTICTGKSLTLAASGGGTYLWNTGDTSSSITVSPFADTIYIVTVTNIACFDIDTIIVSVESCDCKTIEPIPQVITPNTDGKNDVFEIPNMVVFPENELTIFNRWGNIVFSMSSYSNDWKGESNSGENLPDGTYFYIIDLGKEKCQGYVMIHR